LGCKGHDAIVLLNKMDIVTDRTAMQMVQRRLPDALAVSARTGVGLHDVVETVRKIVAGSPQQITVRMSSSNGKAIATLEKHGQVLDRRYSDGNVEMDLIIGSSIMDRLQSGHPHIHIVQPAE
jgi:GTP-binding protein HflX